MLRNQKMCMDFFWSCQTCIVNKVDVLTELKKIKEQLEQEIKEMRMKI